MIRETKGGALIETQTWQKSKEEATVFDQNHRFLSENRYFTTKTNKFFLSFLLPVITCSLIVIQCIIVKKLKVS